ncbi:hypothetical protein FGO68_gene9954 [Halteria grandinella]|uniref:Uncharacterized protein n=1 Tax=Halteria grandinella TaxID=5974 RepID=A0A8J8T4W0_HALGN|nr:hypothetical protein FGO68_gene9954 [Halteria grandinella]
MNMFKAYGSKGIKRLNLKTESEKSLQIHENLLPPNKENSGLLTHFIREQIKPVALGSQLSVHLSSSSHHSTNPSILHGIQESQQIQESQDQYFEPELLSQQESEASHQGNLVVKIVRDVGCQTNMRKKPMTQLPTRAPIPLLEKKPKNNKSQFKQLDPPVKVFGRKPRSQNSYQQIANRQVEKFAQLLTNNEASTTINEVACQSELVLSQDDEEESYLLPDNIRLAKIVSRERKFASNLQPGVNLLFDSPKDNKKQFSLISKLHFPGDDQVLLKFHCSVELYPKTRPAVEIVSCNRKIPFASENGQIEPESFKSLSGWSSGERQSTIAEVIQEFVDRYSQLIQGMPQKAIAKFMLQKRKRGGWDGLNRAD